MLQFPPLFMYHSKTNDILLPLNLHLLPLLHPRIHHTFIWFPSKKALPSSHHHPLFLTTLLHPHLNTPIKQHPLRKKTNISLIVFGMAASSRLWNHRKEYIKLWWRPNVTRGNFWLDQEVTNEPSEEYLLPTLRISSDVSKLMKKLKGRSFQIHFRLH